MIDPRPIKRRRLLALALFSPLALPACGPSQDGKNVQVGDATKAEVKARAEVYKARALLKKQQKPARR